MEGTLVCNYGDLIQEIFILKLNGIMISTVVGELFSIRRISHHPTWMGGNRDLCITADDGAQLWLRWDDAANAYRILEGGRPMPAYTGGRTAMHLPQTEAEFLRLEEESRRRP